MYVKYFCWGFGYGFDMICCYGFVMASQVSGFLLMILLWF